MSLSSAVPTALSPRVEALRDQILQADLGDATWMRGDDRMETEALLVRLAAENRLPRFVALAYEPDASAYAVLGFETIQAMESLLAGCVEQPRALVAALDLDANRRYAMTASVQLF